MRAALKNLAILTLAGLLLASPAYGQARIRDIVRLQGARENRLLSVGLVVGLPGTGDGTRNVQALRSLAQMLLRFDHNVQDLGDINANNVALVTLEVVVPSSGAREGDRLDVHLAAFNGAKSLRGGRLIQCQVLGPTLTTMYALASGPVGVEDPLQPTVGRIQGGALMERDVIPEYLADGRITLVLDADHASWAMASSLARVINEALAEPGTAIATALNPANVVVRVPAVEMRDPAPFIAEVLGLPVLMPDQQARIVINARTGTIIITQDVTIDPVIISHAGLTITSVSPQLPATPGNPRIDVQTFVPMDPQGTGGAKLQSLLQAFELLAVPMKDRIDIIRQLERSGRLHAKVIEE